MNETLALGAKRTKDVRVTDRRKAAMAARLMTLCLGIDAKPAFGSASQRGLDPEPAGLSPRGLGLFKHAEEFKGLDGEALLVLHVVDEDGRVLASSTSMYSLGRGLGLLERFALPLSPLAARWLKQALGEADGPVSPGRQAAVEAAIA